MWEMLIIALDTGKVKATIPYYTYADCRSEIPLVYKGNFPNTVYVTCERVKPTAPAMS